MMTLAQEITQTKLVDEALANDKAAISALHLAKSRLLNTALKIAHDQGGEMIPPEAMRRVAERFVFEDKGPEIVADHLAAKTITMPAIMSSVHLPADVCWIEWSVRPPGTNDVLRIGALIDNVLAITPDMPIVVAFFGMMKSRAGAFPSPMAVCHMEALPEHRDDFGFRIAWSFGSATGRFTKEEVRQEVHDMVRDLLFCLFLITTPRVSEIREAEHPRKLQRARIKRGKPPFIEYKRVVLKIGHAAPRYVGSAAQRAEQESHGKRLHRVIGHFRTYVKGREQPRVSWVPDHLRGDPKLGVLLHEREVKA